MYRFVITIALVSLAVCPCPARAGSGADTPGPGSPAPGGSPQSASAEAPKPLERLAVGTDGWFQPGMLLQGWFVADHGEDTTSTFRIRRAELQGRGEIIPGLVRYWVMIDPAKVLEFKEATLPVANQYPAASDPANPESVRARQPVGAVSMFQDFYITFQLPLAEISMGQFKIPVSWEGYNSSSKLLFAERSRVSRTFGDKRDLGLRITKTFKYLGYSAGLFNGASLNNLDTNNAKDGTLRLEVYPVEGLILGGVIYASLWDRDQAGARDRYELDLRYAAGPFLFQAEFIRGRDVGASGTSIDAQGFYAALAYRFAEVLEPCVRAGYLDANLDRNLSPEADGNDELWHVDAGLNWYLRNKEAKLQLNYSRVQLDDGTDTDEVILAAQVAF